MVLLFILIGLLVYIIVVPFTIYANTWEGRYYFLLPGLIRVLVLKADSNYEMRLRLFFVSFKLGDAKHKYKFDRFFSKSDKKDKGKKKK